MPAIKAIKAAAAGGEKQKKKARGAAAPAGEADVEVIRTLRQAVNAVGAMHQGVSELVPELAVDCEELMKAAGRAWIDDRRAADGLGGKLADGVACANAHRAAIAHACRALWSGALAAGRACPAAAPRALRAAQAIAAALAHQLMYLPVIPYRLQPSDAGVRAFREAVGPAVQRHMTQEHVMGMLERALHLAGEYVSGATGAEPELDYGATVAVPLLDAVREHFPGGAEARVAERFLAEHARRPDRAARWVAVGVRLVTNASCREELRRRAELGSGSAVAVIL